jgi:hypothetical protein
MLNRTYRRPGSDWHVDVHVILGVSRAPAWRQVLVHAKQLFPLIPYPEDASLNHVLVKLLSSDIQYWLFETGSLCSSHEPVRSGHSYT